MITQKQQQFREGAIVKIELSKDRIVFGRLLPAFHIGVYDMIFDKVYSFSSVEDIVSYPILFYCVIYKDVITKGIFEIVGFKKLTQNDVRAMPPSYNQDKVNIDDCTIFHYDGRERKAQPQECIGLEKSSVWEAKNLIERLEDYYDGKRNMYVELFKPLLSKADPRYLPPPEALRWDFEKQEFYRTDK